MRAVTEITFDAYAVQHTMPSHRTAGAMIYLILLGSQFQTD